ncbi:MULTISPECIES: aminoglycoside phosphotransferase family protein [unclassified Chelatococcus]|uniref:aminoglycoside phosphotransferase family protein n=1 Tax=unclassified Chelatococcus TaxID=2638111 RepID=UPI0025C4F3D3|nr:aminoglycoside phosphotransferase family protein [Chelatococcus sp.]
MSLRATTEGDGAFAPFLTRWNLVPDGEAVVTHSSRLLPVRRGTTPAMLKIALEPEEQAGCAVMAWWSGQGAAPVLAYDPAGVLLMERAAGTRSLAQFARSGRDAEATRILCEAVARLHRHSLGHSSGRSDRPPSRLPPPRNLVPLDIWFRDLAPVARAQGGILGECQRIADRILPLQREIVVLHGDIHHDNVLDFEGRGWLAIDPKRLIGERAFDYANIFCNPDPDWDIKTAPSFFHQRLDIAVAETGLDRTWLVSWIVAWAGLSAAWFIGDNQPGTVDLAIAELAAAELARLS